MLDETKTVFIWSSEVICTQNTSCGLNERPREGRQKLGRGQQTEPGTHQGIKEHFC